MRDMRPKTTKGRVGRINRYLADEVGRTYFEHIPLDGIFAKVREMGFEPVMEDGSPWEGFLLGKEGRATIELKNSDGPKKFLTLGYYKMASGKYEVTSYVS